MLQACNSFQRFAMDGFQVMDGKLCSSCHTIFIVRKAEQPKRNISTKIGGDKVKQINTVRNGIESDLAKKIQVLLKGSKIKVQGAIQEDKVRVTGGKRDDLQAAMALIRAENADFPLSFNNFRD